MTLVYRQIASGSSTSNPLFTVTPAAVWDLVSGNTAALDEYFNQAVYDAEKNLPEQTRVEATITGWTVPSVGNVGQQVANFVNTQWKSGAIKDPMDPSVNLPAWPEFPQEIAIYDASTDELVLRWVKGAPWFIWIIGAILGFLGLRSVLQAVGLWQGSYLYSLFGVTPSTSSSSGSPPASTGMPTWEKILLIGGGVTVLGGVAMFAGKLELAKAGASKSSQEIIVER